MYTTNNEQNLLLVMIKGTFCCHNNVKLYLISEKIIKIRGIIVFVSFSARFMVFTQRGIRSLQTNENFYSKKADQILTD